jgi:hypothetical protein
MREAMFSSACIGALCGCADLSSASTSGPGAQFHAEDGKRCALLQTDQAIAMVSSTKMGNTRNASGQEKSR